VLSRVGALAGWETRAVDTFLALRDRGSAPDLVIIPIDEAAFRELGERQPLSRRYLADLTGLPMKVYEVIGLAGEAEVRDATARG
jgi:CHASE2 domain-containing sensor protein